MAESRKFMISIIISGIKRQKVLKKAALQNIWNMAMDMMPIFNDQVK